ncbi:hypothetical protein Q1695_001375 [Nippostrongylus brasiliensis]|nr:hypothetical protein Q1695_001375 [Nippostrongylus brasiliensis]
MDELTDAKGAPVGLASVQYISGSAHPVVLTYNRAGPHQSNGQTVTAVQQPGSTSPNAPEGIRIIPIEKGALNPQTTKVIATTATSTLSQPRVVQATQVVQKQNDNTFRFAQMGSGGQFTVAQPTERSPNKGTPLVMKTAGPSHAILATPKHSITNIIDQQSAQMATTGVHQSSAPVLVAFQPTTSAYQAPQPQNTTEINSAQSTIVQNGFAHNAPLNPCLQGSPRTADLAGNSPHMPNSGQSETVAETGDGTVENPITFDDPSAILTPAVLSMHEEMLRAQQKKIELLLEELTKSQANLKHEQQLILTAKKAQQRLREQQRENASNREREQWLKELDVGHINKQHIQHFIQHRKQQASLQRHTLEHNRLTTTEARLQEELHVEQAVQDIVRLIKQDPRTALLIVQLLRRYQLERNQIQAEQQQANSPDDEKTSQADSPASDEQETLEQSYEMPTQSFEPKPNVVEDDQQVRLESVIICDASGMQLHHDQSVMYHQNNGLMEESKQLTVDMEEIFKTVIEDASRAMGNCNTTAQSIDCTVTNNVQQSQQTVVVCGQQWQQPGVMFQNCVQPQQEVHITTNSGMNAVQPTQMMTTSDNSYEEALHEQSPQMGYSQDMEDLMAVLRDDQDCGNKPGSFQMDLGVGYGSEELAGLIGDDWLDCADRNIGNNGQYAPYISESHGSVGGRSTDPMCMNSHSDDGIEQNMDWLDVVLQNTPIEERPYGNRTMEDDPPKAQFFFAESDEDSLGIADNKTECPSTVVDEARDTTDVAGVSHFAQEEQAELPNFSENSQNAPTSQYEAERDDDIPAQVSGNFECTSNANQEACDVPAVLTDEASSDSVDSAGAKNRGDAEQSAVNNDSEDVPIEVVEVDEEEDHDHISQKPTMRMILISLIQLTFGINGASEVFSCEFQPSGEIPDAPFNDDVPHVGKRSRLSVENHLCDVSDDEMEPLPRGGNQPELDALVDCNSFRNGGGRASSIPPESPPPGESFIYGTGHSPHANRRPGPSTSEDTNGMLRRPARQSGRGHEFSRSPPAPPSTPPRDDRRTRLENLKKLNFPIKYKMKERIDDVGRGLSPPHGPSTPPYDAYDSAPRRNVRSFLDEPGSEFLRRSSDKDNSSARNRSPDANSRRKRRHDEGNDRGDDRDRTRGGWSDGFGDRRGGRAVDDQHVDGLDNGLEDLSNNPAELQRRCAAHIALSENQAASVSDDQLLGAVTEALYLLTSAQRLCKKREKLLNEMKAMRQGEVEMMKAIHADLPAHLQSVVRIEGDNVFINESGLGLGGLPPSTTAAQQQFQQFLPAAPAPATVYMNPSAAPPVGMSTFIVPTGMPTMVTTKPGVPVIVPPMSSGIFVENIHVPSSEPSTAATATLTVPSVPPPAKSASPDLDTGAESSMASSFTNMPSSFTHPPPPISSGPAPSAPPSHVRPLSPGATMAGLPDFSKPPPLMRPVNGTTNGSLPKTGSSNALPDVAAVASQSRAAAAAPPAQPPPAAAAPQPPVASSTLPPPNNPPPPLNFNVPPPNVGASGSGTARAPYMQPSSFLGPPPPGTTNPAQDFTKTITNMITSALKAPSTANAFGARPTMRTFGPGMSLMGGPSGPPPSSNMQHDNGGSGEVEWTNNRTPRYQYRGGNKSGGYGKRQGNDRRSDRQRDDSSRAFDSPKQ